MKANSLTTVTLLIACLAVLVSGGPQRLINTDRGSKRIGFTLENQFRTEENDGSGGVVGEYGVRTGDGCLRVTRYRATTNGGFKVISVKKQDCNPERLVSRVRPNTQPRPRAPPVPRPVQKSIAQTVRTTTSSTTTVLPSSTTTSPTPTSTGRSVAEVFSPVVEVKKPNIKKPTEVEPKKAKRVNRPKQLKKDFDFDSLKSNDNPARALDQKEDPVYSFGFTAPGHGHTQSGHEDGSKKGEYYFDSPDGWRRIVTYVANEKGFFPKMRRERIPGWVPTTPAPRVSRNRNRGGQTGGAEGGVDGVDGQGVVGKDQNGGSRDAGDAGDDDISGKQLIDSLPRPGVGSCPYYFFYNTKVNFHWERCMLNGTKVGQYGKLHEDGYSYRTSYYADSTGYHPKSTKIPLTPEQRSVVHDFTEGVFIIPKPDEERQQAEQRILEWIEANKNLLSDPLQPQ